MNTDTLNWSWTTPAASTCRRARTRSRCGPPTTSTLTTSISNQGRLTINAQVPGDTPPNALLDVTGTITGGQVLHLDLTGTATDDIGVASRCGSRIAGPRHQPVPPAQRHGLRARMPRSRPSSRARTRPAPPGRCRWTCRPRATGPSRRTATTPSGQQDTSTRGATARYEIYPGDVAPVFNENLRVPQGGETFTEGRIPVTRSGRGRSADRQPFRSRS